MNKIKCLAFSLAGVSLLTVVFMSCDNNGVETHEETSKTLSQAKGQDIAYQDFYLGKYTDDDIEMRYDTGLHAYCPRFPADCLPEIVIIVTPKKDLYRNLVMDITNYKAIFSENKELLLEDIHPTLVNGVLDDFFKVEVAVNNETNTNYFRFKRINDGELVGTYPIIID